MFLQLTLVSDEPILFPLDHCAIVESRKGEVVIIFDGKNYSVKETLNEILVMLSPEEEEKMIKRNSLN